MQRSCGQNKSYEKSNVRGGGGGHEIRSVERMLNGRFIYYIRLIIIMLIMVYCG